MADMQDYLDDSFAEIEIEECSIQIQQSLINKQGMLHLK